MEELIFTGFPQEGIEFLAGLERHNNREWFNRHKQIYQRALLEPMQAFVWEIGLKLSRDLAPRLIFEPRVDRSVYRIHRDTRFSGDKQPYKTHMAAILWERGREKFYSPDFYFQFDSREVIVGGGVYMFDSEGIELYRRAVADERMGRRLEQLLADDEIRPLLPVQGDQLKRVPQGFAPDHPRADLLRRKGLYVVAAKPLSILRTRRCLDSAERVFRRMSALHRWLRDVLIKV